jgi:hypothetical protein
MITVNSSVPSLVFRNGGMTFAKSIDVWDRSGKSSLMCLSWHLQQAPLPRMRPIPLLRSSSSCHLLRNRVQDDIARILGMDPDRLFKFVHPFNRPNLFYEVRSFKEWVFFPRGFEMYGMRRLVDLGCRSGTIRPWMG